ncbi:hypothetical protein [Deinococcus sp. YIM 77859]|uniref:hypothetical protein n=1 Tax=Deinococcus sp. YIM 77859 TaxID=1540221 RepID=UPI0005532CB7|nr:hypothetical protein [Deinococcus sp. YIM 77859]
MSEQRSLGPSNDTNRQDARRGNSNLSALVLALATFSLLLDLDDLPEFSAAGQALFLLTLPVLLFGWVGWWRAGRRGQDRTVTWVVYGVALWLRETAGLVSDLTLGRPVDRWDAGFSLVLIGLLVWLVVDRRRSH